MFNITVLKISKYIKQCTFLQDTTFLTQITNIDINKKDWN